MNKRLLTLALAVATTMAAIPAMAQDNFPDVPENHWAYEAIENLKREGILVGYPDGTYKGPRATTRYELAVALNAAYQRLKTITDGLAEQIAEIRRNMGAGDNSGLADRLSAVEAQLRGMNSMADDMAAMKRMADEFQKELAGLGVDVEAMKKDIDSMKKMMGGTNNANVTISGDANVIVHAGASDLEEEKDRGFGAYGIYGIDGRILGWDEDRNRPTGSIFGDLNVYHEIGLNIAGNAGGTKWDATMVYTNLFGGYDGFSNGTSARASTPFITQGYGNQSGRFQGTAFSEGAGDVYIQRLAIDLSDSLPFKAHVGRLGASTENPYLFRRADNTPYFENDRWDNGDFVFDGAKFGFTFGNNSDLMIFAGRNDKRLSTNGTEINPISLGSIGVSGGSIDSVAIVQNTLGAQLKFGLGENGNINLAYLWHGLNAFGESATPGDRLETLGAGLNYKFGNNINLGAGYGQTTLKFGGTEVVDDENKAYWASLDFGVSNVGVNIGYRNIEENYLAPGDWERLGTMWSPRGIEDFQAGVHFNAGAVKLHARGIFGNFQDGGPDYNSIKADADFGFGGGWMANLGFEQFTIENDGPGDDARQRWITAGVRRNLGSGLFKLVYQYGDHNFFPQMLMGPSRGFNSESVKGHILFGQVTVKF